MEHVEPPHEGAIGIFDSGVGGLTVMQQIAIQMPHEDIIYFGDTLRVPYGDKTPQAIIRYSIENVLFLMDHRIKILVNACNTSSAYALEKLKKIFKIPVIGVIEAGVEQAVKTTKTGQIAVLGTRATIRSNVYQSEIKKLLPDACVHVIPCPLLVHLVEEQWLSHEATKLIIKKYVEPLQGQEVDTILLGCTHYPLLRECIQEAVGEHISIVDSASSCAKNVNAVLGSLKLYTQANKPSMHSFYVSEDPEKFQEIGQLFLGRKIDAVQVPPRT